MELHAQKFPADLAGSGWYEILPPPGPAKTLEGNVSADWVVIGAGFAGMTAARRIVEKAPGDRVVVVDAQRIAWGAAGRNSGFMIDLPHNLQSESYGGEDSGDRREIRMNRAAMAYATETAGEFCLDRFFSPIGKINAATSQAGIDALDAYSAHLDRISEPYTRYDAAQLREITGIDYYISGIHTPGCIQIQPAAYIRGLAEGLRDRVTFYENSPVQGIESGPGGVTVSCPGGRVTAGKGILTVNGHLESFGLYRRQLMHVFTFASMTRQLSESELRALGGEREWGITPAHPMGTTVRRLREGRIVIRNTFTYNPNMETSAQQVERLGHRHDTSYRNRFPVLAEAEMEYRWGGHLCLSRNSVPVFGEIGANLFCACCQNGLGTVKGTLGGMLIVDLALGEKNPMIGEMLASDPPDKLFPEPFMTLGARGYLWWNHRQAGADL